MEFDQPTFGMTFMLNTSPLSGQEGKPMTSQTLYNRLKSEEENNPSIRVQSTSSSEAFEVFGRGDMQLSVIAENIRREGCEFSIRSPRPVIKMINGIPHEPFEEVNIEVPSEYAGMVIDGMSRRKGELVRLMEISPSRTRLNFLCSSKSLLGYHTELKNETRGLAIFNRTFSKFLPSSKGGGGLVSSRKGSLISMTLGVITPHALLELEDRGIMFVEPGAQTYPGMIIGECNRDPDLRVNPCRVKILSNVRQANKEGLIKLRAQRSLSLEDMISFIRDDEVIELTPKALRLRKMQT
jgi:GTP-binding protein